MALHKHRRTGCAFRISIEPHLLLCIFNRQSGDNFLLLALSGSLVRIDEVALLTKTGANKQVGIGMTAASNSITLFIHGFPSSPELSLDGVLSGLQRLPSGIAFVNEAVELLVNDIHPLHGDSIDLVDGVNLRQLIGG